ncbi:CREB-binding protein [Taenia solium]|eukprot:TsM_000419500 transcript=TsM_000419500 gene=TsM_000419500
MENLNIIPSVFNVADIPDGIMRIPVLQVELQFILHTKWCLLLQEPPTTCTDPHCSTFRDVYQHTVKCTAGVNCKMLQCAPSRQLLLHHCNCEDQQCSVYKPMKYAFEERFYPIERESEKTNRGSEVTYPM